jgi:large subunit ribosomal protein L6
MSRIGKKIITIPKNVSIDIEQNIVLVKGKHGSLDLPFQQIVEISINENQISVQRINDEKQSRAYHGLIRALLQNMILGVSQQFSKTLIAEGVGYKFQLEKKVLILNMGYTHPIKFEIPEDISIKIETPTKIIITGINKEKVGFWAAKIRNVKPPEPYKGKGILYEGEKIIRKAGKTGK